jgi:metal-dependent amidase/aminoacylase/carboxypeptidase family protein
MIENKIDNAASHSAAAIGAACQIDTTKGYYPLEQSRAVSDLLRPHMIECVGEGAIKDEQKSFAAGDLGDVSLFKPTIQFGFSGCKGTVHGCDFMMENSIEALIYPVYVLFNSIIDMLNDPDKIKQIKESYKPKMSKEMYFNQ